MLENIHLVLEHRCRCKHYQGGCFQASRLPTSIEASLLYKFKGTLRPFVAVIQDKRDTPSPGEIITGNEIRKRRAGSHDDSWRFRLKCAPTCLHHGEGAQETAIDPWKPSPRGLPARTACTYNPHRGWYVLEHLQSGL